MIGAPNRPEMLDPALLRAGRVDRIALVGRPGKRGRADLRRVRMKPIAAADPETLVNEAALIAARRDAGRVGTADVAAAVERSPASRRKKTRVLSEDARRRVVRHAPAHALASPPPPRQDPARTVSMIPRAIGALGYGVEGPTGDRDLMTRDALGARMAALLAGRAADRVARIAIATGADDDLKRATDIARSILAGHGVTAGLGRLVRDAEAPSVAEPPMPRARAPPRRRDRPRDRPRGARDRGRRP